MGGRATRTVRAYAPGRTELAGNHTDHQGGRVIAATVSCGIEMLVSVNGTDEAHVQSEGFEAVCVDVRDEAPRESEHNTTAALVRGVIAALREAGAPIAGFDARVSSTVPAGSGLSSSAAFELALAMALAELFDAGSSDWDVFVGVGDGRRESQARAIRFAQMCQRVESGYFGKPCGLMDQATVALGGVNLFDFSCDPPSVKGLDFDFSRSGYALCLIDTRCDHSRYTGEYAQVARDMAEVARFYGARTLSEVPEEAFLDRFRELRETLGDLPALRGLHYYHEMSLVDARAHALEHGDIEAFLEATRRSGASSAQYLQNVSVFGRAEQPAMIALALADRLLEGEGAVRIHGGGFGGTVQAFVPFDRLPRFTARVNRQLGAGACRSYDIVREGAQAQCL